MKYNRPCKSKSQSACSQELMLTMLIPPEIRILGIQFLCFLDIHALQAAFLQSHLVINISQAVVPWNYRYWARFLSGLGLGIAKNIRSDLLKLI